MAFKLREQRDFIISAFEVLEYKCNEFRNEFRQDYLDLETVDEWLNNLFKLADTLNNMVKQYNYDKLQAIEARIKELEEQLAAALKIEKSEN